MNVKNYLNKPFPLIAMTKYRLRIITYVPIFVFIFLLIFRPFGISSTKLEKSIFLLGFPMIIVFILTTSLFIFPVVFKSQFDFHKWSIKKTLIFVFIHFIPISIVNWIYNVYFNMDYDMFHYSLLDMFYISLSIGIIPIIFLLILAENYSMTVSSDINKNYPSSIPENATILSLGNDNHRLQFDLEQLICIKSEGNYVNVYISKNDTTHHELIRITLTEIMQQLNGFDNIVRCHRSYVINLNKIHGIAGKSRSLSLKFKELSFGIPIARRVSKDVKDRIMERI